jgi:AhpD family alkylhydroperoxidase
VGLRHPIFLLDNRNNRYALKPLLQQNFQTSGYTSAMSEGLYPKPTKERAEERGKLAPEAEAAFQQFSKAVFREGALSAKAKQLIAVAVAHVTQCPYCIRGHTKAARKQGASPEEIMEAIWVAAEMRAGGAFAHSALALDAMAPAATQRGGD